MIDCIEIKGLWWLPGNPDIQVAGVLEYTPMGKTKLELIGEFRAGDWLRSINAEKGDSVIWGLSSDNKKITLLQNYPYALKNSSCPFPIMNYDCQFIIIGKYVSSLKEESQYSARILFDELSYWYRPNLIQSTCNNKNIDLTATYNSNNFIVEVPVTDEMKFILEPRIFFSQSKMGLNIEVRQATDLVINFKKPVHLQFILNVVKEFEQILSVATLSHVQCKQFFVFDEKSIASGQNHKIEILHHYFREEYNPNTKFTNYLFTYASIKNEFPSILQKWYSNEDIIPVRAHLVESLNRHGVFSSTDFLIVVQAIEGFYCRFRKDNQKLDIILKALVEEFRDIRCIEMEDGDYSKIVDTRNHYSHLLPPGKKTHVVNGFELYNLDFKLRKILLCCVLNFMGLNNSAIDRIVASSNNNYLRMVNKQ